MLKSLILLVLMVTPVYGGINYYYFSSESCRHCKVVDPIVRDLQEEGFNIKIIKEGTRMPIRSYPTIVIEITGPEHLLNLKEILRRLNNGKEMD